MKPLPLLASLLALVTACLGCAERDSGQSSQAGPNVVEVTAIGLTFNAPDEIPSGWTTLRLVNQSGMTHFAVVERLPEGIGIEDQQEQVAPVFQEGMNLLNEGKPDSALAKFGELPEWFSRIEFLGGPGLISPGHIAQTTVYLGPGTYLLECYVKTNGVFHSYNPSPDTYGMVHEFTVTPDSSTTPEPKADVNIVLSSEAGIVVDKDLRQGEHTVAVHFGDQTVHENFVGHDVHLIRLQDDTNLDVLTTWMNWAEPIGLETPAPVEFLGGCNEMSAGQTAYFTVILEPGRYAWISEVPSPQDKGMLKIFTVPEGS